VRLWSFLLALVGLVVAAACSATTDAATQPTLLTAPPITTSAPRTTSTSSTSTSTTSTSTTSTSTTTTTTTAPPTTSAAPSVPPATTAPPASEPVTTTTEAPPPPPPAVTIATTPAQPPTGAANQPAASPPFDAVISDFMRRRNLAGASVAVSFNGQLVYAQTYGTVDVATGEPVAYTSRFNLASLSKVITAATVMHLADEGRIDLEAKVVDVLDGRFAFPSGYDRRFDTVTVRQLLSHTSGLNAKPPLGPQGAASCDDLIGHSMSKSLIHEPGNYRYANANYCLLGKVLESLDEGSWFDVVQRETLLPLGITDVALGHPGQAAPGDVVHRADPVGSGENPLFLDALGPAGQLIATPDDVVRVVDALWPGNSATPLVRPETLFAMVSPQSVFWAPNEHYGYGLFVWDGGISIGHTGSLPMVRSMVVHQSDGYTWCILVNGTFGDYSTGFRHVMRQAIEATGNVWPAVDYTALVP
jgi:CubicO group peptidase (beta-lactamase class C family)